MSSPSSSSTNTTKYSINSNTNQLITCKVCGDRASGKHYGVPSCDGCRGFFKRSIRRNLEYHCKESGTCIVDVSRRNQCQACRFAKCLKVNMRREAVQHERAPRSYITQAQLPSLSTELYTSKPVPVLTSTSSAAATCNLFASEYLTSASITNFSYNTLSALPFHFDMNFYGSNNSSNSNSNYISHQASSSSDQSTVHKYLGGYPYENIPSDELIKLEIIYEAAAKLLFLSVRWIRSITEFNQLSINDQKILLQHSWFEIFIVTAAQWGLNLDGQLMRDKNIEVLQNVIDKYQYLRIDNTEGNCLKALILFNSNYSGLMAVEKVCCVQEQALSLLHSKCGTVRFGHILLFMPNIKVAASNKNIQEILFKGTIGEVAIERILSNLLNNIV